MTTPRTAVVIPCFNDGSTLPETLASLRGEEPHELVVVDDGSTDAATLALLDELAESGARVLRRENGGPAAARTEGARAAGTRYVFPLDADDLLAPGALATLGDALDAEPDACVAWGDEETFGDCEIRLHSYPTLDPWRLTYANGLPISSLIRRSCLLDVGGWQLEGYEDWDLWLALAASGRHGVYVPRVTGYHRVHGVRRFESDKGRHDELYAQLRARHRALFERRRENRKRSPAPLREKLLLPLLDLLPASDYTKHRLGGPAVHPVRVLSQVVGGVLR